MLPLFPKNKDRIKLIDDGKGDKLTGWDWCWLLYQHPKYAKYCDWSKLSPYDKKRLFNRHPELKNHPMYKLSRL